MAIPAARWMIPADLAPPQNRIHALAGSWYAYLSPQPVNDRTRNVVNITTCWIRAERSKRSISVGMSLSFIIISFSRLKTAEVVILNGVKDLNYLERHDSSLRSEEHFLEFLTFSTIGWPCSMVIPFALHRPPFVFFETTFRQERFQTMGKGD